MAAFLEKLFKSRKPASPHRKPQTPTEQRTDKPEENKRAELREEQLKALQADPGQKAIAGLATEGVTATIRLEAAHQLTDTELLQDIQKQTKGRDKGVYQAVRQKLQTLREEQARQEITSETITTLINNAENQAKSDDTKLYEARLDALLNQWAEVEASAAPDQISQFLQSVHSCRDRLADIQAVQAAEQRQDEQARQRDETLTLINQTLNELKHQPSDATASLSSLDALQKTQENRWLEATRDTHVEKQQQKTYDTSMLALRNYIAAVRHFTREKDSLTELSGALDQNREISTEERHKARALIKEINWPEGYPAPDVLESTRKLAGKPKAPANNENDHKQQQATADNLDATLVQLEAALEANQLKESKQLLKQAQQHFKALNHRYSKGFQSRMQLLTGQLRELNDWQGFATEPKQVALCEQMEHLAEQPIEPETKAGRIKDLQAEWRDLGGSSNRALWSRFKQASDTAYEPCKTYFKAKSDLKQVNLEKRKALCEELEHFLNEADWDTISWKAVERILQTARQEWKAAWPIEFRDNRQVQKQFDGLLKQLEAPIADEHEKNEALKQSIVEQAQALVDHEPLSEAMNKAKALQSDWKAVGITRHREDRKLWQAFRKACDDIFARRDTERSEQKQATKDADTKAATALQQTAAVTSDQDAQTLAHAIAMLNDLDNAQLSTTMKEQARNEKQRLKQAVTAQELKANITEWQALILARAEGQLPAGRLPENWAMIAEQADNPDNRELVIRAEIFAGVPSPEADQQARMEIQVQRLAEGIGSSDKTDDVVQNIEALVACWCLKPADEPVEMALATRLNSALTSLTKN